MEKTLKPLPEQPKTLGVQSLKKTFLRTSGKTPGPTRANKEQGKSRVRRGDDPETTGLKLLIFGPWGSGKTFAIKGLLELGYRVFVMTTDFGGSGLRSVTIPLRRAGKGELLKNLFELELRDFDEVMEFLEDPTSLVPEFWSLEPDVLFWDGFSAFQGSDLMEYIGEGVGSRADGGSSASPLRLDGFQIEGLDWNAVKNATLRSLKKFCLLSRPDGKMLHKIVTCQEGIRPKAKSGVRIDQGTQYVDERKPLLSGQAGVLMGGAFDLIIETRVITDTDSDDAERRYVYVVEASDSVFAKKRGVDLPPVVDADMAAFWRELAKQSGFSLPSPQEQQEEEMSVDFDAVRKSAGDSTSS